MRRLEAAVSQFQESQGIAVGITVASVLWDARHLPGTPTALFTPRLKKKLSVTHCCHRDSLR